MNTEYLSCAETAKLIRAALAKAFPRVKFSVRSKTYSGGASITVHWTDGPTSRQVDDVAGVYAGGGFDGMIDMAYSKEAWLMPDGSATFCKTRGTEGSKGTVPADQQMQPSFKARRVHFGANYVFTNRSFSEGFYRRALESACRKYGEDPAKFEVKNNGWGPFIDRMSDVRQISGNWTMSDLVHQELSRRVAAQ